MTDDTPTPDRIASILGQLPDLCALLPDALITRTPHDETARPAPGPKPPVRLDVLHLLDTRPKHDWVDGMEFCDPDRMGVLPYLDGWCRDIEADMLDHSPTPPTELPDPVTVTGCCAWLTRHLDWAQDRPQWPEMAWGIHTTHRRVKVAVRAVQGRPEAPVPCGRCGAGTLNAIPAQRPLWECNNCGHHVTVQAVTLNQAAKIMRVPKDQLYRVVNRPALLRDTGIEQPKRILGQSGGRLYDLNDLRRVIAEMRYRSA